MVLVQAVQVPLAVADEPFKNWFVEHFGWSLHSYPLVKPEHGPVRYWVALHLTLLQAVQMALLLLLNRM